MLSKCGLCPEKITGITVGEQPFRALVSYPSGEVLVFPPKGLSEKEVSKVKEVKYNGQG